MSEPTKPGRVYIDENAVVHEGREAEELLRLRRDNHEIDPQRGVAKVGKQRWEEAQRYERRTWMEKRRFVVSDRNESHRERFENYTCLRGMTFARGIELGCGPFTNMRLILRHCSVQEIHLLDPLVDQYLSHPFCQYRHKRLGGVLLASPWLVPLAAMRPGRFLHTLSDLYQAGGLLGRPVHLAHSMIETFQTDLRFDLVVMVNVIEHCQDAGILFDKIREILAPGGIFVFADRMYRGEEVRERSSYLYDAGHPLRVDQSVVKGFLDQSFDPLMKAEFRVQTLVAGVELEDVDLYYVGRKR